MAATKMQQMRFHVAAQTGVDQSVLCCASTFQTGFKAANGANVVVGCMVTLALSPPNLKITVRTASQQVAGNLIHTLSEQLASS
jgi:hypothetical protein